MALLSTSPARRRLEDLEVAAVLVDVDGEQLSTADDDAIIASVEVDHAIDRPARFHVETSDLGADEVESFDSAAIQEGRPIKIAMGFGATLQPVFAGDVTGLEFDAEQDDATGVTIVGYDRMHRLVRARRTAAFVDKKDSEIVTGVVGLHDLQAVVTDTAVVHPYVMQREQTDLAFLLERARRIGFTLRVEDDRLFFAPRGLAGSGDVRASFDDNLLDLRVTTSLLGQVGAAVARGWQPDKQQAIARKTTAPPPAMGGRKTGLALADDLYGAQETAATGAPLALDQHADQVAAAELEAIALRHVTCSGCLIGTPELRPGMLLTIEARSRRISGTYWLTRVVHTWDPEGFFTRFEGSRTAT